ncbi:glycosyltransferase [Candidatus Peregrinibacteria bacterium]|jgi:glycosyltransferase involved in cell wall biosynthesis|nr:glycosyltransferase [Candidatus Peregrinibacteria bacterium]
MKLFFCTSSYPAKSKISIGSLGSFQRDWVLQLIKHGIEVFVITPAQPGDDFDETEENLHIIRYEWAGSKKGAELSSLNIFNPKDLYFAFSIFWKGTWAVLKLAKKERPDFTFALWAVPCGFFAWICKKIYKTPYAVWTLGSDIWVYGRKFYTRPLLKTILKSADKLYSDGFLLGEETGKLGGQKCDFLPSTQKLTTQNLEKVELPYIDGKINFLFIGRYHHNKGPDVLLEAINILPKEIGEKCHFHMFGGGDLEPKLREQIQEYDLKNVTLNGFVNTTECSALLRSAHFFIVPSREDSIPVILSDGLQCFLPVIAAQVGDMTKLLNDYKVGYSFPKEDVKMLAQCIQKAVKDDKQSFKPEIDRILNIFDISKAVDTLAADIQSLIKHER